MMFFSRIRPSSPSALLRQLPGNVYAAHQLAWNWFSDSADRKRDFLLRQDGAGHSLCFFTASARAPRDPSESWVIETKRYEPSLDVGDALGFTLRANPTRSVRVDDDRGKRHDVVMHAKTKARIAPDGRDVQTLIYDECFDWLARKGERCGFSIERSNVRVSGFKTTSFARPHGGAPIRLATVDFDGVLRVEDATALRQALFEGVGPAKAFGCGLLMVRRV